MTPPAHNSETLDSKLTTTSSAGIINGIPLPRETLALIALSEFYRCRSELIDNVVLKTDPCFIGDAINLADALVITEQLLHESGISTERQAAGRTSVQELRNLLRSNENPSSVDDKALLAAVNERFRPWLAKESREGIWPR